MARKFGKNKRRRKKKGIKRRRSGRRRSDNTNRNSTDNRSPHWDAELMVFSILDEWKKARKVFFGGFKIAKVIHSVKHGCLDAIAGTDILVYFHRTRNKERAAFALPVQVSGIFHNANPERQIKEKTGHHCRRYPYVRILVFVRSPLGEEEMADMELRRLIDQKINRTIKEIVSHKTPI